MTERNIFYEHQTLAAIVMWVLNNKSGVHLFTQGISKYWYILILVKDTGSACVTISAYPQFLLYFEDDNRYLLHNVSVKIKLVKHFEHNKSSENVSVLV